MKSVYVKLLQSEKELKFLKRWFGVKALVKTVETRRRDRAMSKDTGELIIKIDVVGLFLAISRVWFLRDMSVFCGACHI